MPRTRRTSWHGRDLRQTSTYTYGAVGLAPHREDRRSTPSVYQYGQTGNMLTETAARRRPTTPTSTACPSPLIQPVERPTVSAIHTDRLGTPQKATDSTKTLNWGLLMNPNGAGSPSPSTVSSRRAAWGCDRVLRQRVSHVYADHHWRAVSREDLIGLAGGMNPYVYAGNNPYRFY